MDCVQPEGKLLYMSISGSLDRGIEVILIGTFLSRLVGVWNLPSRREGVKKKVTRAADSLARQMEESMKEDLQRSIEVVRAEVEVLTAPYLRAAEEKQKRVEALQEQLHQLDSELKRLRQSVQNIGS